MVCGAGHCSGGLSLSSLGDVMLYVVFSDLDYDPANEKSRFYVSSPASVLQYVERYPIIVMYNIMSNLMLQLGSPC